MNNIITELEQEKKTTKQELKAAGIGAGLGALVTVAYKLITNDNNLSAGQLIYSGFVGSVFGGAGSAAVSHYVSAFKNYMQNRKDKAYNKH